MKSTFLMVITSFFVVFSTVSGQSTSDGKSCNFCIQDVSFSSGTIISNSNHLLFTDFKTLAPQSVLLTSDFTGFEYGSKFGMRNSNTFAANVGINFKNKNAEGFLKNPQLRIGLMHFSGSYFSGSMFKEVKTPYDTLQFSQTGQQIYIDSVHQEGYYMNYFSEQLQLDASLIFKTNPEARWSLFSGLGITTGFSYGARTEIDYITHDFLTTDDEFKYQKKYDNIISKSESFKNKSGFTFSAFIPMGVDFRIGKKREFWKQIHLFYEMRPSITIVTIPELQSYLISGVYQGFGIRVKWN